MEYTVQSQSLTQVANAIREKTRDPALLEFPDEFVVAIRSIQPQQTDVIGGTVGWNQLVSNGDFSDGVTGWSTVGSATRTVNNKVLTIASSAINATFRTLSLIDGHKYAFFGTLSSAVSASFGIYKNASGTYASQVTADGNKQNIAKIVNISASSGDTFDIRIRINVATSNIATAENIMVIDLTTLLGSTIADAIYTLEQSTPGAGIAIIKQLLTKDYYPYSLPDLSSIMYANDWENFGDSYILNGFLRLSSNSLYRWGDTLSNGNVTPKTTRIAMTDLIWTSGTMAAYEATLPNWVGSNAVEPILETVISDAYPTALYDVWSGLTPTDLSAAPDKYLYQIYESQSPDTKHYKIYIKDTSIATVSDLMTALAGKEIVFAISDENYAVAGKRYRGRADIDLPDARTLTFGDDPEYAYFYRSPGVEQTVTQIIVTATKVSYINENGNEIEVATLDSGLQWDGDDYGQLIWFGDNAPDMSPEDYEWFISLYEEII